MIESYELLCAQLSALVEGERDLIANLSNASALLMDALEGLNWAGFYLRKGEELVLGPFQGKPACIRIPLGRGVCGTAAQQDEIQLVPDVHAFPGHIACDSASNSEIVIPMHSDGAVSAVLDIDSPSLNRFTAEDREGLAAFAAILESACCWER
jgi:GAF domain-containing protein